MNIDELLSDTTKMYTFENTGATLTDEEQSRVMFLLHDLKPDKNKCFRWDDIGLSNLFIEIYGDKVRYCPQQGTWYLWKTYWKEQADIGEVSNLMETMLGLLQYYCDETENEEYRKYIKKCSTVGTIKSVLDLAKNHIRLHSKDMDTNPYLLNTKSGLVDLRTGKIIPNCSDYAITKITNSRCLLKSETSYQKWYDFIDQIMSGDKEKAAFLQRALGYSLLGTNDKECMFIAYGAKGRNGKGTLFETLQAALSSDYMQAAQTELICLDKKGNARDYNSPQPCLSALVGARIVNMQEATDGIELDAASIKALTGRDSRKVRGLYEKPYDFIPQFTMWLSTNYFPRVTDKLLFKTKRIWVIEFNESWADSKNLDDQLKILFKSEKCTPTVLSWLIDGCRDYMEQGLNPPKVVIDSTRRCEINNDRVLCFTKECCEECEGARVSRSDMKRAYTKWCRDEEREYTPLGSSKLYAELQRFYDEYDEGSGNRGFKNVKLIAYNNTINL